ncbi:MAG TPA: efflux RND transporter periplasmic adaptor subunit [Flavitalea sp.]|nr:efflux RND transporter periplasmic adaptor subunit [Flavitalea sp.]
MMRIKNLVFISLVIPVLFSNCGGKAEKKQIAAEKKSAGGAGGGRGNQPLLVEGYVVKTKTISENIEAPGTLMPFEETEIRPETSGRVVSLNIPEGRVVRKGTILVRLFDGDLQAQLKKLEVQLSIAEKTVERYRELLKISGISQQEVDLSELQANNLRADINLIKVDIGRTQIRAPFDGTVGLKNISLGAYVTPSNIITTLRQVSQLKLEFTIPEKYSDNMSRGKVVNFAIDGVRQKFGATVIATEAGIEQTTRSLRVLAIVRGKNPALVPGTFAKVLLQMGQENQAMIIPTQAVVPQARNKRVIVYKAGIAQFQVVTTGIRDSTFIQVIDGLNVGDTIITTGLLAIRPESKVTISKVQ